MITSVKANASALDLGLSYSNRKAKTVEEIMLQGIWLEDPSK